jgi:hypothetical protein
MQKQDRETYLLDVRAEEVYYFAGMFTTLVSPYNFCMGELYTTEVAFWGGGWKFLGNLDFF